MNARSISQTISRWFESRFKFESLFDFLTAKTVPVHRHSVWYYGGSILITFFMIQVVTGIALLFYYQPTPETAYESVSSIILETRFGWLIRSIHSWSANLMVAAAFLHLFSTFFLKAYRKPRELTWISGTLMFFVILGFGFSGYLLPWNELSYFATKVGTGIAGRVPWIGVWLKYFLRGGEDIGASTLTRFFALHVVVLPFAFLVLAALHLFFVQIQGMSVPVLLEGKKDELKKTAFFPDFLLRDSAIFCLAVALVVCLAVLFPWELGKKADPLLPTPTGIKPEWYFLFMFQALQLLPGKVGLFEGEQLGIIFFLLGFLLMLLTPVLDRRSARGERSPMFTFFGVLVLGFIALMTVWAILPTQ